MCNMVLKLPWYFSCWWRNLLVVASKFDLLTIRWHSAITKHLFFYPQGDRSGLRKPKKEKNQHKSGLPPVFTSLSQSKLFRFSFNQPNRKRWNVRLLLLKLFLLWHHHWKGGRGTFPQEVRLTCWTPTQYVGIRFL